MRRSVAPEPRTRLLSPQELTVETLGECRFPSPIPYRDRFVDEDDSVLVYADTQEIAPYERAMLPPPAFEPAGARGRIFFDPTTVSAGVVTCGGLCPGINDVIRSLVLTLTYRYGVQRTIGFRYGFAGLAARAAYEPVDLSLDRVQRIHDFGGTILGSSRGAQDVGEMVDTLVRHRIDLLFAIGGDGTMRGSTAIAAEIRRRGLSISVVGIPKTIDNDLHWVERTFGFATAVEEARRAIKGAHVEAKGAEDCVAVVKLMGRHSGFIAAHATLACSDVNFCLVPEVPLVLDGPAGFLVSLEARVKKAHHAVVVVAEGAGQDLLRDDSPPATDASGNVKLGDIGLYLRERITEHFRAKGLRAALKYIDPSYIVRSLPANAWDSALCLMLGQHAVHAAMSGRTNLLVSYWNQRFTHVPLDLSTRLRKQLDPDGELWLAVLDVTGQPTRWTPSTGL